MDEKQVNRQLFDFIEASPSPFHVIVNMKQELEEAGYECLLESKKWTLSEGGKYYVTRNGSSLIAFRIPKDGFRGFQIMASHSDSPSFRIKENPEMEVEGQYVKLNVEKYGGMLMAPWFDRPLSIAGRIVVREGDQIATKLVSVDRDLCMIPSLAVHMNREVNDGYKYNPQKDLLPLYGCTDMKLSETEKRGLLDLMAEVAHVNREDIIGNDLFLYNRMKGSVWGADEEFVSIGKLDDLQCAFASLQAFLASEEGEGIPVHCVFDNEEVGSGTRQGAASTFLYDTLVRIVESLGLTPGQYRQMLAESFMLSADNAHAVHPNYAEKTCPTNRLYLNQGVVIKYSGNQKYTTDGVAAGMFIHLCEKAQVPYQIFHNRSDMAGGSTLGNISAANVPVRCVDIGLAQLAMHSPYETAGAKDTECLIRVASMFYQSSLMELADGVWELV